MNEVCTKGNSVTSTFIFSNSCDSKNRFGIIKNGNIYSKSAQPAQDIYQRRIARLYHCQSAISYRTDTLIISLIKTIAGGNEYLAVSSAMLPEIYNIISDFSYKSGIICIDFNSPKTLLTAIKMGAKAVFMSSSSLELSGISISQAHTICNKLHIPLIIDNTLTTAYIYNPFDDGANIVIETSQLISVGDEKNNYTTLLENGNFRWMKNNKYSKLYPYRNSPFPLLTYLRSCLRRNTIYSEKETQSEFFMLCEGLRTLESRVNIHSYNNKSISKIIQRYSTEISYNIYHSKPLIFLKAKLMPEYINSLKNKLKYITVNKKSQLFGIYNSTAVYFEENTLYIKFGTEPVNYLKQLFEIKQPLYKCTKIQQKKPPMV